MLFRRLLNFLFFKCYSFVWNYTLRSIYIKYFSMFSHSFFFSLQYLSCAFLAFNSHCIICNDSEHSFFLIRLHILLLQIFDFFQMACSFFYSYFLQKAKERKIFFFHLLPSNLSPARRHLHYHQTIHYHLFSANVCDWNQWTLTCLLVHNHQIAN